MRLLTSSAASLALLTAVAASPGAAQEAAAQEGAPLPKVPARVVRGELPTGAPEAPGVGVDRGVPAILPYAQPAELPRPGEPVWVERDGRDELVVEAGGDPHFLGFVGGEFRPPAGERVDPRFVERVLAAADEARPEPVAYGFAMLAQRHTPALRAELEGLGVRVLGFHPHHALAVAVDAASLGALADHPAVRWVGPAREWQKLHPNLGPELAQLEPGARVEAVVTVFDDDLNPDSTAEPLGAGGFARGPVRQAVETPARRYTSNGWQQRALEDLGVEVGEYLPGVRAFAVRATADQLLRLVALDFVYFAEARPRVAPAHDDSAAMLAADYTRGLYDGGTNDVAIGGLIDSGLDLAHAGLDHPWYLGWAPFGGDPYDDDACGHGSHVTGTILGVAPTDEWTGMAPGLAMFKEEAFRVVRTTDPNAPVNDPCDFASFFPETVFAYMRDPESDGQNTAGKPHFVNCSWGTAAGNPAHVGSETNSRQVDNEVYDRNQVYVFAAGNSGPNAGTVSQEATAKNALSVGNVVPYDSPSSGMPGSIWIGGNASSQGPTGDGRWKPNVVAPGTAIVSVTAGTGNGYNAGTGTSMAAPHVSGVVAQLVDRHAFLRYRPERVASLLMATASPKADELLTGPGEAHLDTYGAGRVDAYRALFTDSQHGWSNWGFQLGEDQSAVEEFDVPVGTDRLIVVMHYLEPASGAGAGQALVNDFDLILDAPPLQAAVDAGDYFAQQSGVNNTEIRAIDAPPTGTWRWKVVPDGTSGTVKMSVTVHRIMADTTPAGSFAVEADDVFVKPGEDVAVTATVGNTQHVASAVFVETLDDDGANLLSSEVVLKDGIVADMLDNTNGGDAVTLGNVRHGWTRSVDWVLDWASEGVKTVSVRATSDNGMNHDVDLDVTVDGTKPGYSNPHSTSHLLSQWSNDPTIDLTWSPAPDNLAGVGGYGIGWSTNGTGKPAAVQDLGAVTQTTQVLATQHGGHVFNLRAVDKAGNWSDQYGSTGPFYVDTVEPLSVTGLISLSHLSNTWTSDPEIDVKWFAATDAHSGVAGYATGWSVGAPASPGFVQDIGNVTSTSETFQSAPWERWFNIRTRDVAGNWNDVYSSAGPFLVDTTPPVVHAVNFWNEVATTTETTVEGLIVQVDAGDYPSGVQWLRARNAGGDWSPWVPFGEFFGWNLTLGNGGDHTGTRVVEVEVGDKALNVSGGQGEVYLYHPHTTFGTSGIGAGGKPEATLDGIVKPGGKVTFGVKNSSAPLHWLFVGSQEEWQGLDLPLALDAFDSPGCTLYVAPDTTLYLGPKQQVDVTVPNDQALVGATVHAQWLLLGDPSGKLVVNSDALALEVNGL